LRGRYRRDRTGRRRRNGGRGLRGSRGGRCAKPTGLVIAATSPVRAVTIAVTVVMMPGSVCHQLLGFPSSLMDFSAADSRHQATPLHGAMRAWRLSSGFPRKLIQRSQAESEFDPSISSATSPSWMERRSPGTFGPWMLAPSTWSRARRPSHGSSGHKLHPGPPDAPSVRPRRKSPTGVNSAGLSPPPSPSPRPGRPVPCPSR